MRHRFLRRSDLRVCSSFLTPELRLEPRLRQRVPDLWAELMGGDQMLGLVIEDPEAAPPLAIAAFGVSVFVADEFLDAYLAAPRPDLAGLVYQEIDRGRSPVLAPADARAANAGAGLNLIILHYCQRDWNLAKPGPMEVFYAGHTSFRLAHEGYRIKRAVEEFHGAQRELALRGGFLLKSDFGAARPAEAASALFGLYRDDPESRMPGTTASFLFRQIRVRFHFSHAEQRMLLRALIEEGTDGEIAAALGLSLDTVKKLWRSAYQRVAAVEPRILGIPEHESEIRRGTEKRRHLLAYLRSHLEELRPLEKRP